MKTELVVNEMLADFARELDLDPEDIRMQDGYTCIGVDRAFTVHLRLSERSGELDLFMELGTLAKDDREVVLSDMLQGNVLLQGTDGAALGLDQERDIAVLSQRLFVTGLDHSIFRAFLERFLTTATFWRTRLFSKSEMHSGMSDSKSMLKV